MKFAVKVWSNGTARAGVIHLGSVAAAIDTPSLILSTRKGLPLFIPPDLLPSLPSPDSRLLHVSPLHFLEGLSIKTIAKIGGLHQLVGLHDCGFAAFPRDSIQCLPEATAANKTGASFETPCGRLLIKPAEYMEMISSMKPELWATLADEVPAWVSDKRNKTSVDRTIKWLDECIALSPASGAAFGAIVGGSSLEERRRCAQEVATRNVSGYWIGGFGLAESMDERPALLNAVTEALPEEKPRLICGLGLPEEILQGVAAGFDLFESTYIYHLTLEGFALTFPLDGTQINGSNLAPNDAGSDPRKINLRATVFRKDATPIVEGCTCYTCQNHTRAYINHLLNVHEMLAQTLLEIHNTHHFLGFFRLIREAIKAGRFEEFRKDFVRSGYDHLVEDVSEGVLLAR
ncbi:pentatricopeptide repeat-containing protein [Hibiscus syriacus]|uniref:Queuine tRNA-ribosyltransferase accessory subunit 2 n=1 Tax=Hibiscus syriacus TaxID=106335 RepID=A0A6A2YYW8_HIBSY|nr:queuine tRNA-ribosyltransferase accessory subunit 2-like [Hibiscus syriacus]KAE8684440.1 pentatricopeptide repeat-containing protein [Hibiscus syriacus]